MSTTFNEINPFAFLPTSIEIPTFTFDNMPLLGDTSFDDETSLSNLDISWMFQQRTEPYLSETDINPAITFAKNSPSHHNQQPLVELPVFNQPADHNTQFYKTLVRKFIENKDEDYLAGESRKAKKTKKPKKKPNENQMIEAEQNQNSTELQSNEFEIDDFLCDLNIDLGSDESNPNTPEESILDITDSQPTVTEPPKPPKDPFIQIPRIVFGRKSVQSNLSNQKMESESTFDYKTNWLLNEFEDMVADFITRGDACVKELLSEAKTTKTVYGQKCLFTFYNFVIDLSIQRYDSKHISPSSMTDDEKKEEREIIVADTIELFSVEMQQKIAKVLASCGMYKPRKRTEKESEEATE